MVPSVACFLFCLLIVNGEIVRITYFALGYSDGCSGQGDRKTHWSAAACDAEASGRDVLNVIPKPVLQAS